ncbi:MAG TPA: hypothetical protein VEK07_20535 [Polyangiaceae bacterium]|nr:hypothetical protein [Polyangiaceae bacterium]
MLGGSGVSRGIGVDLGECSAREVAAWSSGALDAPLEHDAALSVGVLRDEALVLGAYQRAYGLPERWPLVRRASGGPEVRVGATSVYVGLSIPHPGAAPVAADPRRIVNRAVRPLLRALTRAGCPAQFFGRDWVAVRHHPAAWVGFAHDSTTQRTLFEAFVAVAVPFAVAERSSFRGRSAGTLESLTGRSIDPGRLATAIVGSFVEACEAEPIAGGGLSRASTPTSVLEDPTRDPPWAATCSEAIGIVGAGPDGRGAFRVGGDLLVSRDALARLEERAAAATELASDEALDAIVADALDSPRVALDGVRSLSSIRDVIARALRRSPAPRSARP